MEESSDKDDRIKVILDQNKTLTKERSKLLSKLEQQQEELGEFTMMSQPIRVI